MNRLREGFRRRILHWDQGFYLRTWVLSSLLCRRSRGEKSLLFRSRILHRGLLWRFRRILRGICILENRRTEEKDCEGRVRIVRLRLFAGYCLRSSLVPSNRRSCIRPSLSCFRRRILHLGLFCRLSRRNWRLRLFLRGYRGENSRLRGLDSRHRIVQEVQEWS